VLEGRTGPFQVGKGGIFPQPLPLGLAGYAISCW